MSSKNYEESGYRLNLDFVNPLVLIAYKWAGQEKYPF